MSESVVYGMIVPREFPETRGSLVRELGRSSGESMWREFYGLYASPVYRVARLRGLDPHDADDVVQQVMLAVISHIKGFEYRRDRGRFRAWIRRIAENKIADLLRARARAGAHALPGDLASAEAAIDEHWESQWRRQDLHHCLKLVEADVSPRRMEAFRRYVLQGQSAEETARGLGMTRAHVYVVRGLVLSLLRARLIELECGACGPAAGSEGAA